jgi:large subunit ribosomal protein L24
MNRHKPKLHIRKEDTVYVLSGNDKGKKGRVLEVLADEMKAFVEGVNIVSRHLKANTRKDATQGGIVKKEAPIHLSKLALLDPKDGKPTRVGRRTENGKTVRFSKRSKEVIK